MALRWPMLSRRGSQSQMLRLPASRSALP